MRNRFRFVSLSLLVILVAFMIAPVAKADEWNKETIVRFSRAVEVPGQVLPAGKYVFKLADSQSDRRIVQIFSEECSGNTAEDLQQLLATPAGGICMCLRRLVPAPLRRSGELDTK